MPIDVQLPVLGDQDTVLTHTLTATLGEATNVSTSGDQYLTWAEPNILLGAAGSSRLFEDQTQPYYLRYFSVDRFRIGVNSFRISTRPDTTSAGNTRGLNLRPLTGTVQISLNDANDQEIAVISDPYEFPASNVRQDTVFTYKRNNVDFSSTFANFVNLYNQSSDANKAATLLTISAEEVLPRHTPPTTIRSSTSVSAIGEPDPSWIPDSFRWSTPRIALPATSLFTDDNEYYAFVSITGNGTRIFLYLTPTSLVHRTISSVLADQNTALRMTAGNLELVNDAILDNSTGCRYFQDGSELSTDFFGFATLYEALSAEDKAATRLTLSAETEIPVSTIASITTKPPLKDIEYITFRVRSG